MMQEARGPTLNMNSPQFGLRVAATIFGLVCLAQLARLALRVEVVAAGITVPFWPSGVAVVITGGLCVWLWRLSAVAKPVV